MTLFRDGVRGHLAQRLTDLPVQAARESYAITLLQFEYISRAFAEEMSVSSLGELGIIANSIPQVRERATVGVWLPRPIRPR